jgi:6-pyruvoyltetrahydropterin/6-carboxytetrahydropterin synthase
MYTISVKRDFIVQHYLIGGDWGLENQWHSHHYQVEVLLEGASLDQHGYLADIVDIEANMKSLIDRYQDHTLNELPEFIGLNPSIEHFSRIFCESISQNITAPNLNSITVRVWEDLNAWASYRREF